MAHHGLGHYVGATPGFVPYYYCGRLAPEGAWLSHEPVTVDAADVVQFMQTSPLLQHARLGGAPCRAAVKLVNSNNNKTHPLFYEVTNAQRNTHCPMEGFVGLALAPTTEEAKMLIEQSPDVVLNSKKRGCICEAVMWTEEVTCRLLGFRPPKVRLQLLKSRKHRPVCALSPPGLFHAERAATKELGKSMLTSPQLKSVHVSGRNSLAACKIALDIPKECAAAVKNSLYRGRLFGGRGGLPSFAAVRHSLNQQLDSAIAAGVLDGFSVLAFRPCSDESDAWSVFIELERGREKYALWAPLTGLYTDEKVNVTANDGVHVTLLVTSIPTKPTVNLAKDRKGPKRETIRLHMAQWQHLSVPCFAGVTTRADNKYAMENRTCIEENLNCTRDGCPHKSVVKSRCSRGGFVLYKPECIANAAGGAARPAHKLEGMDLCSATMSGHYLHRRASDGSSGGIELERLVLCHYHAVAAYAAAACDHLKIGGHPTLVDRAQR